MRLLIMFFILFVNITFAEVKEIDNLLEKVNHASTPSEKKVLIEKLKQELANNNKKAREEADAIIKAKEKIPLNIYDDKAIIQ